MRIFHVYHSCNELFVPPPPPTLLSHWRVNLRPHPVSLFLMESARNNFWLAGHVPNFKNASSRLPFQWISFDFFKLIQTNDNRTHHSQSAGSFYRLHWNTVDMNSCRTQWCSYMKRNCGSCVNRWCIHQHLRMEIQGADVSNMLYSFKATCTVDQLPFRAM